MRHTRRCTTISSATFITEQQPVLIFQSLRSAFPLRVEVGDINVDLRQEAIKLGSPAEIRALLLGNPGSPRT